MLPGWLCLVVRPAHDVQQMFRRLSWQVEFDHGVRLRRRSARTLVPVQSST